MWWKLCLYILYLAILFILSRILEAVSYYEGGYLASRLLDPVGISVRKLKTLLDQRGVSYAGVVEKQELTELVEASGDVTEGELEAAQISEESTATTNFTCGTHFYEEVEDTKDSVWVVQVVTDKDRPFMRREDWQSLIGKVSRFGVRTGILDCSLDWRHCERKKWYTGRLILALPQGHQFKDSVTIRSYTGTTKVQAVLDWINFNLASRIKEIYSAQELYEAWSSFRPGSDKARTDKQSTKLRVILFATMKIPPMFFSVLSVKFSGRMKFGIVHTNTREGQKVLHSTGHVKRTPGYLIMTPEGNYTFGSSSGEYWNYNSMALFFKTLHPESNDIFLLSLIWVNIMCWFEVFIAQGNLFKRLGSQLWYIGKWNCLLILLWLPVLALFQLPYMDLVLEGALTLLRVFSMTTVAGWMRADLLWYSSVSCSFLVATFLVYSSVVGLLHYLYKGPDDQPNDNNNQAESHSWWSFNWDSYGSYLFRPMSSLTRPMSSQDLEMDIGMELLIERLAVPNFWLRPMISSQYINDLPVWKYTGPSIDSDIGSDTDCCPSPRVESEGEEAAGSGSEVGSQCSLNQEMGGRPLMFVCEKCRTLQKARENEGKTEQQLEEERLESESACAKYLMDGDYKCMCQNASGGHGHGGHGSRKSPKKERYRANSDRARLACRTKDGAETSRARCDEEVDPGQEVVEEEDEVVEECFQIPGGIIYTTECAICLESYKYAVRLCGLPCGHSFHQDCIVGWLTRDNHCCPLCRWPAFKAKPCSMHSHVE